MHHCSIEGRDLAQCIGMPQLARGPVIVQGRRPGQLVTPSRQIYRCHLTLVSDKFLRASSLYRDNYNMETRRRLS